MTVMKEPSRRWPSLRRVARRLRSVPGPLGALVHRLDVYRAKRYRPGGGIVERTVEAFASEHPEATVLVIGAHDGAQRDPLRPYLLTRNWRAYLLEPVPDVYRKLVSNTRRLSGVTALNVAISVSDGSLPFYTVRPPGPGEDLWPWYDALGSFDRSVIASHTEFIPDIEDRITETQVQAMRGETFLRRHQIDHVDLLQVDTEGHDLEVLRQLDLAELKPAVVVYEHWHLDEPDREAAVALLAEAGYEARAEGLDTVCVHHERLRSDGPIARLWRSVGP